MYKALYIYIYKYINIYEYNLYKFKNSYKRLGKDESGYRVYVCKGMLQHQYDANVIISYTTGIVYEISVYIVHLVKHTD